MNDKKDDKDKDKIGGIKSTKATEDIKGTTGVSDVSGVKGASSIGSIGGAGDASKRRSTRVMTLEEREELFKIVKEEASSLFGKSGIPKEKQAVLEDAVKMAIDSGLLDEEAYPKKTK
jgi:hypothetical protein